MTKSEGHPIPRGGAPYGLRWATNHPQKIINFSYRGKYKNTLDF